MIWVWACKCAHLIQSFSHTSIHVFRLYSSNDACWFICYTVGAPLLSCLVHQIRITRETRPRFQRPRRTLPAAMVRRIINTNPNTVTVRRTVTWQSKYLWAVYHRLRHGVCTGMLIRTFFFLFSFSWKQIFFGAASVTVSPSGIQYQFPPALPCHFFSK